MAGQFPQTWSTLAQVAFSGFCEQSTQSCTQSPSAKEIVVNRSTMNNSFLPIMFFFDFGGNWTDDDIGPNIEKSNYCVKFYLFRRGSLCALSHDVRFFLQKNVRNPLTVNELLYILGT